jgi:hypothetical protein
LKKPHYGGIESANPERPIVNSCWKTILLSSGILMMLALSGCARHYVVTMHNGSQLGATSKPRLESGVYVFKDATGQETAVPAGRVREIAPASMTRSTTLQGTSK